MTINKFQKELNYYHIYILVAFHDYHHVLKSIQDFGKYDIVLKSDKNTDSLGSHILGFVSTISRNYALTEYHFRNKSEMQRIINTFVKTSIKQRRYDDYRPQLKGHTSAPTGRKRLTASVRLVYKIKTDSQFRNDLENYGQTKWDILAGSNNFDDYYDFKVPKSAKPKQKKVLKITLSPREQCYLKWLKSHARNNNDEDFKGSDEYLIHYLLGQDSTIDWHKHHQVMERSANLELAKNGELADLENQLHAENKK